jgi:homoserine O-acetyltransferase
MTTPVSTQFYHHEADFRLRCGEELPGFTMAYETWGELNADRSNAVLLFHALSGSQHAAGYNPSVPGTGERWTEECHHGWWEDFIGPGKALDTAKWFVICANSLGGCYGTTGPSSLHPRTGKPWGSAFPQVTVSDNVRAHLLLLDHLGIRSLHAVMGASVGGLCALNLATTAPERVRLVVPIASGCRTTVLNRLIIFEQIMAIENDRNFRGGDYYGGEPPTYGLALARMISHKTFVHLDEIEKRARGDVRQPDEGLSWYRLQDNVESYILHQGTKFVRRFDANTYLRICGMWSSFDPVREGGAESWGELLGRCRRHRHHFLVFSIDSDFCFYPEEQAALVRHLEDAGVSVMHITAHSHKGHDSFLLEPMLYTPHLVYALDAARPEPEAATDPGM